MNPLHDFLIDNNVAYTEGGSHRHVRYGWTGIQCPYCRTSSWHMGIRDDGYTTCWRCGAHRLGDILMEATQLPWPKVKEIVHQIYGNYTKRQKSQAASKVVLPTGRHPLGHPHKTYLERRNFNPETIEETWGIEGISIHSYLAWRLFIPIVVHNCVVSWTTRTIGSHPVRYMSAKPNEESIPLKTILYGCDFAHHTIIVVEGATDAWRIGKGAVATLGLTISESQVREIGAYPIRVVCFDNSDNAQRRADSLASRLSCLPGETEVVRLETGDDPASADIDEINEMKSRFLMED